MKHLVRLFAFLFFTDVVFGTVPHAYVCDQLYNRVTVLDVTNDTTAVILGFAAPRVVHLNADGTLAFVGSNDGTIRIIDTTSHTLLPIVVNVAPPVAMAVSPDASFIYVASNDNTVSVIRTSDYMVSTVITGFDKLQDIKIRPDGAYAYVTNAGNGTVSVIRTSDKTVVDTISGFLKPIGLTLTVDGRYGYVTETSSNSIRVFDTSTNTIVDSILGLNFPTYSAVAPNKTYIYVANLGNDTISIIRTSDNFIVDTITIPAPKCIAVTADGNYLYIGSEEGAVVKIDLINYTIVTVFSGFSSPSNIALTNNNTPGYTVNGCQVVVSPTDVYNMVSWKPIGTPTSYKLYRDGALTVPIVTLPAGTLQYNDNHLLLGQVYSYYVVAEYSDGFASTIGSVEVIPTRLCQNP